MRSRIPPTLRPGSRVCFGGRGSGSLGPIALTDEGDIRFVITKHRVEGSNGLMYLEPEMIPVAVAGNRDPDDKSRFDCSLKMKDVFEELPIVLKKAIEPELGRMMFKVGMVTGFTSGKIRNLNAKPRVDMKNGKIIQMEDMIETNVESMGGIQDLLD